MGDEALLINAYRATQYNWYERRRATFDQIVSSGAMALISDRALLDTAIGVYNTQIYALLLEEGQNSKFRELFRMSIDPAIQEELGRRCGDIQDDNKIVSAGLITLEYDCSLDLPKEAIATAAAVLRTDPEFVRTLRLRNVQTQSRINDFEGILQALGLRGLFPEVASP